jgi:hypothetical protein
MIEEAKLVELIKAKLPQLLRDDEEFRALVLATLIQYLPTREEIKAILERMDRFEERVMAELLALREDFNTMQHTIAEMQQTQKELLDRTTKLETAVDRLQTSYDRLEFKHDRLEHKVDVGFSRFGILFEDTLRKTLKAAVENWLKAAQVESVELGGRQMDIVIRDSEHILLEVTARPHSHDIDKMKKSAADYEQRFGVKPRLAIACAYLTPDVGLLMLEEGIELISGNPPE